MMDKKFNHQQIEEKITKLWEKHKCAKAKIDPKKEPYTILLPPPNANDPLHIGHAMYVVEDILCRWKRMQGYPTLFLPGTDHAGIETQYVFEKHLKKEGKSRFDFDRKTLYQKINEYVEKNRGIAKNQLKRLGFSLDWSRECYTLEKNILKTVLETFRKLHKDGLIYRDRRLVNYCTHCGTAFSNLEIDHQEEEGTLWYIKYPLMEQKDKYITVATTRPETMLGDTAVAVHPEDTRYKNLIGKKVLLPLTNREVPIVADAAVDPEFGTGAVKTTPAHDQTDFEIGIRHNLEQISVIGTDGRITKEGGKYEGQKVKAARKNIVNDLEELGLLEKTETHQHSVSVCYRCNTVIEPMLMPQWFVDVNKKLKVKSKKLKELLGVDEVSLAGAAYEAVKQGHTKIVPDRFQKLYFDWMERIYDWNISRQIVWGPRIPVWYCTDCNPEILITFVDKSGKLIQNTYRELKKKYKFGEIEKGLQELVAPLGASYSLESGKCPKCGSKNTLQETDTFDTWFSSGQWPLTTLEYPDSKDFKYFYPTAVLDTMWDILFFWVARMMMFGLYLAGDVPFRVAHMHARVVDKHGKKMSKSRNNVADPLDMVEKYGADALRYALVYGSAPGSDIPVSDDKVRGMRNFANKIWNMGRFVFSLVEKNKPQTLSPKPEIANKNKEDEAILQKLDTLTNYVNKSLENYRFSDASLAIYEFAWHEFADKYIESTKNREDQEVVLAVLTHTYKSILKLLHPFMPFVTEAVWQEGVGKNIWDEKVLMVSKWASVSSSQNLSNA